MTMLRASATQDSWRAPCPRSQHTLVDSAPSATCNTFSINSAALTRFSYYRRDALSRQPLTVQNKESTDAQLAAYGTLFGGLVGLSIMNGALMLHLVRAALLELRSQHRVAMPGFAVYSRVQFVTSAPWNANRGSSRSSTATTGAGGATGRHRRGRGGGGAAAGGAGVRNQRQKPGSRSRRRQQMVTTVGTAMLAKKTECEAARIDARVALCSPIVAWRPWRASLGGVYGAVRQIDVWNKR